MRFRVSRRSLVRLGAATALGVTLGAAASSGAPAIGPESPVDGRIHFNVSGGLATLQRLAARGVTFGGGALPKTTCTSTGVAVADVQLSCDDAISPEDETPVVVDPADPNHLLAGSNDYYLVPTGSTLQARVPTGFFVAFDGGATWTDGQIPMGSGNRFRER
jgi:hypothetical protein